MPRNPRRNSEFRISAAVPEPDPIAAVLMAMLRVCTVDGCDTKTLGQHCLVHEVEPTVALPANAVRPVAVSGKRRASSG
jgi:hypothetical protein